MTTFFEMAIYMHTRTLSSIHTHTSKYFFIVTLLLPNPPPPLSLSPPLFLDHSVFCTTALLIGCAEPRSAVTFLPTTYVTAAPTRATPHTRVTYHATICDSKPYRGRLAVARVNIPAGWRLDIGIFAKIEIRI